MPKEMHGESGGQYLKESSPTGIKELDDIIGGGFPKDSIILLSGSSGSGKTIFALKWLFEGAKNKENGIYISTTEPLFKMVKHLEAMSFYDRNILEQEKIKIVSIQEFSEKLQKKGLDRENILQLILNFIEDHVKEVGAKRLCIDSVTAIAHSLDNKAHIRRFIFELGEILAALGCTAILTSEVAEVDKYSAYDVEEFISDVILRLDQIKVMGELQRVMQVVKVRGRGYRSDELHFRITEDGIVLYPKIRVPLDYPSTTERISTGNAMLDEMTMGGVFRGSSTFIAGSTGTGKSLLSLYFMREGLEKGEPCLYAGFEESREQLIRNAQTFGWNLEEYEKRGLVVLRCMYPNEKHLEEHLTDMRGIVEEKKIKRCVVDSLSAIQHSFDEDEFLSFAKRLNGYLKTQKVTTFFTAATESIIGDTKLTGSHISTLIDNIIMLRYVEVEGEMRLVMNVTKVRGSSHSKGLREYKITDDGIVVGKSLSGYEGIMTGVVRRVSATVEEKLELEFKNFIGPMATSVFMELKNKGLSRENIINYIDKLSKQKILKAEDAIIFKQNVEAIIGSS